jgi:hypothetical protein
MDGHIVSPYDDARSVRADARALVEALLSAIQERDQQAVWDLLDEAAALHSFPRAVREEALVMVRLPKKSVRAPMKLYLFHEQLRRLDEEPPVWSDPDQLDLGIVPRSGAWRSRAGSRADATRP